VSTSTPWRTILLFSKCTPASSILFFALTIEVLGEDFLHQFLWDSFFPCVLFFSVQWVVQRSFDCTSGFSRRWWCQHQHRQLSPNPAQFHMYRYDLCSFAVCGRLMLHQGVQVSVFRTCELCLTWQKELLQKLF
jgi:hypothetical protein